MKPTLRCTLASTLLFGPLLSPAQADSLPLDTVERILEIGKEYGVSSYKEIEAKGDDRFELEGWKASERRIAVKFDLDGRILEEETKRGSNRKRGLTDAEILQAVAIAQEHGMKRFEEIELDERDRIEIEGRTDDGTELELKLERRSYTVLEVDRD
ncbi:PepSY domain-containing protein [Thioalkalivibrio sp. HL-Eb18]|uniref:PepSY domain-containing protein n=1 Tax=Thioalkalivibrio sp. HL-Eb18 TaxID=1266913 RepID=UPI00036FFF64|nr:PepSY domain-containing protein [Thioalkalivibrio sp. HL-Eb18]